VYTATATDPDAGAVLAYSLSGTDAGLLSIDSATGAVKLNAAANFEAKSSYSFNVVASDGTNSVSKEVTLNVTDLDENTPPTITSGTIASINENVGSNVAVYDAAANDAEGDSVSFYLVNGHTNFTINATTGVVTFNGNPDFEETSSYQFTVGAFDSNNEYATPVSVELTIEDVNEHPTIISGSTATSVPENSGMQSVYTASAVDPDGGSAITYSLTNNTNGKFAIDSKTGIVTFAGGANFESPTTYTFTVRASDGNLFDEEQVTMQVTNVNEAPIIISGTTATSVQENSGSTQVYTAAAVDPDAGSAITYTLTSNTDNKFTIDSKTGVVTFKGGADYESPTVYTFTVRASDGDSSDDETVTMPVKNVNEPPNITSGSVAATVQENGGSRQVYTAVATDPDAGSVIKYSLTSNTEQKFSINETTGVVTFSGGADKESPTAYTFTVRASDGQAHDEETVTMPVNGVDEGPVFSSGTTATPAQENSGSIQVYTALAVDPEGDPISYSLVNSPKFSINATTGVVTFSGGADFEAPPSSYSFTVRATSNGKSADLSVSMAIQNVNERPTITSGTTASAPENSGSTNVYTATAVDPDAGSVITYSLAPSTHFTIDSKTGVVTFVGGANHESPTTYAFTVYASDGKLTDNKTVTLAITNVNEGPTLTSGTTATEVPENSGSMQVYTATATDPDVGDTLTYTLPVADSRFSIDGKTGVVTFSGNADYEITTSIKFTVRVTDSQGAVDDETVTLPIKDVVEQTNTAPVILRYWTTAHSDPFANRIVFNADFYDREQTPRSLSLEFTAAGAVKYSYPSEAIGSTGNISYESYIGNIGLRVTDAQGSSTYASTLRPVVLDLSGSGIEITGPSSDRTTFDVTHDGVADHTGWIGSGNAMLVFDADGDSMLSGASEIALAAFGPAGATDLEGLAFGFDSNKDGVFDAGDEQWTRFGVFQDKNQNGQQDNGEFQTLSQVGIRSINLTSNHQQQSINGCLINGFTSFTWNDGHTGTVADVEFGWVAATGDTDQVAELIATMTGQS
jgi:hypothetical protein